MNRFRYQFRQFMQGRYGTDQLYYALLVLYLILLVLNMCFRKLMVFNILAWAVFIIAFYRVFSRNLYQRGRENDAFLRLWNKVRQSFGSISGTGFAGTGGSFPASGDPGLMTRLREFPQKKYTKCPHCKATLRLPRQRGKHTVRCPRCNERFGIHIIIGSK